MPPRLNKRQQREQEEAEQIAALARAAEEAQEEEDEEEDQAIESVLKQPSGFAALNEGTDENEPEESEEEVVAVKKSKSNKKKKKVGAAASTPSPSPSVQSKKSKSKAIVVPDDGLDEIDIALAELGMGTNVQGQAKTSAVRVDAKWEAIKQLLSIDPKSLDSEAELRRFFGTKVIAATPISAPRSQHHARFANNPHHATSLRRTASYLANPEAGWASLALNGLSIERYEGIEAEEQGEWWSFVHSPAYKESQYAFLEVLQQADGNRLFNVLERNPYSIDTLMQLSEMNAQQGDIGASSTYLSKALYALSAPLPTSFLAGSFRLAYGQVENRAFFLAVARKVALLVKRGTWRTAAEWSKIALGVGGVNDPVGMLLFIDFLMPKAKQDQWFLSFLEKYPVAYPASRLESYPGLAFAKALCLRNLEADKSEDDEKSTAALRSAILRFPMVASLLYASLGGNIPPKILSHRRAQLDGRYTTNPSYLLSLLSECYVARSSPLWKEPETLAWFQKTANAAAPSMDDSSEADVRFGERIWLEAPWEKGYAPAGIIRAAAISEIPSLRPYLPPTSGSSYSFDPIPPSVQSGATFYNEDYFRERKRAKPVSQRALDQHLRALEQTLAGLAQVLGLGDNAAPIDMGAELREEMMREYDQLVVQMAQMRNQTAARAPPGAFPAANDDQEEEEEGEGEEEDQNIVRRLMAMFGGRGE